MTKSKANITSSTSWDGKHILEFNEGSHRYKLDGIAVRGATTIGSSYPKAEALIRWMIQQGIEEYTTQAKKKKGGEIGTILHTFAECYEKGIPFDTKLVTESPHQTECEKVIERFLSWRKENDDEIVDSEGLVASVQLQVGGKIDTLRKRKGKGLILSDYKTSKGIYMEQLLQVIGGYRRMLREWRNIIVPYVEIVTFPKLPEDKMHVLLADEDGWVKDGIRTDIPYLFKKIEDQFARNVDTFHFRNEVDSALFPKTNGD